MSMIKRRMELQAEFAALNSQEVNGKNTALSKQFLRTLPLVNHPNFSRHNIVPVYTILVSMKDTLRSVVSSASAGRLAYKQTESELMREVDLNVGHPIILASFDFANSNSVSNAVEDYDEPLFLNLEQHHFSQELTLAINGFQKMLLGFSKTSFWHDWYKGFLDGKPVDWELQRRVALIPDNVWADGPEAVAEAIREIEANYLASLSTLAETIDLNPDTGKFRATPTPVENAPLMSALLTQIADDLEDAMAGHNGVTENSSEARKIRRVVTRYGNDPQQAELTLTTVAKNLRRQLHETHEIPDSSDNIALLNSVEEGVRGIRANHPEVAANREQLAQIAFKELSAEDRETLEKAAPVLSAISEGAMAEDFAADIPELLNDALLPLPSGVPRLPGADASTRIFSRVSKMALLTEQLEKGVAKGAQFNDSKVGKTIQIAGSSAGLAAFLFNVVQIGLRLFGVI